MKPLRNKIVNVLDIGSSKISCFTAKITQNGDEFSQNSKIIAGVEYPTKGFSHGIITDIDAVRNVIAKVIEDIEIQINTPVDQIFINFSGGMVENHYIQSDTEIDDYVTEEDIDRLFYNGLSDIYNKYDYILHAVPIKYNLDGTSGIEQPIGMMGRKLSMDMLVITSSISPIRQIILALEKCKIKVQRCVLSSYASALGAMVPSEMDMGAISIDIGADLTCLSAFSEKKLIFADILKVGGQTITKDIANYFSIPLPSAENLKISKGACNIYGTEHDQIQIPVIGENFQSPTFETISRSELIKVVTARVEEIIEKAYTRLKSTGLLSSHRKIILTGGTSSLVGIDNIAKDIFGVKPRIAYPLRLIGMPQPMSNPSYSVLTGLLSYACNPPKDELPLKKLSKRYYQKDKPIVHKVVDWVKYNF